MTIVHQTQYSTVHAGDCLDVLKDLPDESVDAVITDPPYGLSNTTPAQVAECLREWATGNTTFVPAKRGGYMGKDWDSFVPPPAVWKECFRVLKPGGHLLAFAGSRTQDLMGMSVRMAGFDIRDSFAWLYGSGFPKSMDVSKAIDKAAGAKREVIGPRVRVDGKAPGKAAGIWSETGDLPTTVTAPATPEAQQWEGWGTALKPAFEPVIMARKPITGNVAANVLEHGTGALNIDASRIRGRFPANVLLDESQAAALDEQSGILKSGARNPSVSTSKAEFDQAKGIKFTTGTFAADSGGASRFFYVAKATKSERPNVDGVAHPTVKPLTLLRYLVRMVTPPGGTILDPFAGSGTTLEAATKEGFTSIGIEAHPDYLPLIAHRLERTPGPGEPQPARNHTAA